MLPNRVHPSTRPVALSTVANGIAFPSDCMLSASLRYDERSSRVVQTFNVQRHSSGSRPISKSPSKCLSRDKGSIRMRVPCRIIGVIIMRAWLDPASRKGLKPQHLARIRGPSRETPILTTQGESHPPSTHHAVRNVRATPWPHQRRFVGETH